MHRLFLILLAAAVAGCASYRPMVMRSSVGDPVVYEQDLAACQDYARQVNPARAAATGAFFGGLIGAVIGAAVGDRDFALYSARATAAQGAAYGAANAAGSQVDIIRRCMSAHGYVVLN